MGAISGKEIRYAKNEVIECDKDDLKHLGNAVSEVKEENKKAPKKSTNKK